MNEYQHYIRLLLEQEEVLKEGKLYQLQYVSLFRNQLIRNYQLMLSKLYAKKSIEYFEKALKKDKLLNLAVLDRMVREDLKMYELEFQKLEIMCAHNIQKLPHMISSILKDVFGRLLQRMHPDLQKDKDSDTLYLWYEIERAYMEDDLSKLLFFEYEVSLQKKILYKPKDIEERIERVENQIRILKKNFPYTYKSILENPKLLEEKREVLEKEFGELLYDSIIYQIRWEKIKSEKLDS